MLILITNGSQDYHWSDLLNCCCYPPGLSVTFAYDSKWVSENVNLTKISKGQRVLIACYDPVVIAASNGGPVEVDTTDPDRTSEHLLPNSGNFTFIPIRFGTVKAKPKLHSNAWIIPLKLGPFVQLGNDATTSSSTVSTFKDEMVKMFGGSLPKPTKMLFMPDAHGRKVTGKLVHTVSDGCDLDTRLATHDTDSAWTSLAVYLTRECRMFRDVVLAEFFADEPAPTGFRGWIRQLGRSIVAGSSLRKRLTRGNTFTDFLSVNVRAGAAIGIRSVLLKGKEARGETLSVKPLSGEVAVSGPVYKQRGTGTDILYHLHTTVGPSPQWISVRLEAEAESVRRSSDDRRGHGRASGPSAVLAIQVVPPKTTIAVAIALIAVGVTVLSGLDLLFGVFKYHAATSGRSLPVHITGLSSAEVYASVMTLLVGLIGGFLVVLGAIIGLTRGINRPSMM